MVIEVLLWCATAGATPDPLATTTEHLLGIDPAGALLVQRRVVAHDPDGGDDAPPRDGGCLRIAPGAAPAAMDQAACAAARPAYRVAGTAPAPGRVWLHPDPIAPILLSVEHGGARRVLAGKGAWDGGGFDDTSFAVGAERPVDGTWSAAGGRRALAVAYTAPDAVGNAIGRTVWVAVPDLASLPAASALPCAELRPGRPGATRRAEGFEAIVARRLEGRFEVRYGPAVEHERRLPQVLYREGYAVAAGAVAAGWRTAPGHDTLVRYDRMQCPLTIISAADGS